MAKLSKSDQLAVNALVDVIQALLDKVLRIYKKQQCTGSTLRRMKNIEHAVQEVEAWRLADSQVAAQGKVRKA